MKFSKGKRVFFRKGSEKNARVKEQFCQTWGGGGIKSRFVEQYTVTPLINQKFI